MRTKFNTRIVVFLGLLTAISIVVGRYLNIPLGNSLRISFLNIPIILASLWFGPLAGVAVGAASDVIGTILITGNFNPLLTITSVIFGLIPGLMKPFLREKVSFWRILIIILIANIIGTIGWSTYVLSKMFGTGFWALLSMRIPLYIAMAVAESVCVYYLSKSRLLSFITGFDSK